MLSIFGRALQNITSDELKKIAKNQPALYTRLRQLYDSSQNLETLFALAKLCLSLLTISSFLFLLYVFFPADQNILPTALYLIIVFATLLWLLPSRLIRSQGTVWLLRGHRYAGSLLGFLAPTANRLAPPEPTLPEADVSLEELKTALPDTEHNAPSIAHLNLYKQVLRFDKLMIQNVMRPKKEITGIKANYNFKEVLTKINTSSFSRLPVYDGSWHNILGIIHCKDLLPFTSHNKLEWNQYIRPIVYVKPTDLAQAVLRIFQHSKNHMAIVKDEQSNIVGIVTLEDITEEIIGEIDDE